MASGGLGLAFERAQLSTHFANEVLDAEEVRLGAVETALGLLFPFAVLEDSRCFFDDRAAVFGTGIQHGIDLALADDHVLLTSDAGVGEKFLNVEQATFDTVDGVFAFTRSKERSSDGDLGEFDRQETCRVVERQHHLGATESRTLFGSGEDDVVHLLAAHCGWCLSAENPCDRVDHVGLARAIRPDHHGHPGLEFHHRRIGEGFEAFDGQGLEKHSAPNLQDRPEVRGKTVVSVGKRGRNAWIAPPPRRDARCRVRT